MSSSIQLQITASQPENLVADKANILLKEMICALGDEIKAAKKKGGQKYYIYDG